MILIPFISALILLESREVFQGLLSQPFVTAILMVWAGYDQNLVLAAAAVTHLIYLNRVPSGTTMFPEYPYGFFITVSLLASGEHNMIAKLLISVPIIIIVSAVTAYFLAFKRRFFEKHREYLLFFKGRPNLLKSIFCSLLISFVYSIIIGLTLKLIAFGLENSLLYEMPALHADKIVMFMCLIPAVVYIYKNLRLRK